MTLACARILLLLLLHCTFAPSILLVPLLKEGLECAGKIPTESRCACKHVATDARILDLSFTVHRCESGLAAYLSISGVHRQSQSPLSLSRQTLGVTNCLELTLSAT